MADFSGEVGWCSILLQNANRLLRYFASSAKKSIFEEVLVGLCRKKKIPYHPLSPYSTPDNDAWGIYGPWGHETRVGQFLAKNKCIGDSLACPSGVLPHRLIQGTAGAQGLPRFA